MAWGLRPYGKLTSFRPQRTIEAAGPLQVPYIATLDGSFMGISAFVKDFEEDEANHLAITQVQIASSDSASDHVVATVAIVGFLNQEGGAHG
jgi:hypothetical protein